MQLFAQEVADIVERFPWRHAGERRSRGKRGSCPSTHAPERSRPRFRGARRSEASHRGELVFTHVHSNRLESGQIAIQRRRPRAARTEIESRRGSEGVLSQEWVRFIPCFHTATRKRQVGPGRHDRRTDGRSSRALQHLDHQRRQQHKREAAPGRVARQRFSQNLS